LIISQTKTFGKQKSKLFPNQIKELDRAVKKILNDPSIGDVKKGDLQGIRVYKFRMLNQEYLLAYTVSNTTLFLLSMGTHENFYRELKRTV